MQTRKTAFELLTELFKKKGKKKTFIEESQSAILHNDISRIFNGFPAKETNSKTKKVTQYYLLDKEKSKEFETDLNALIELIVIALNENNLDQNNKEKEIELKNKAKLTIDSMARIGCADLLYNGKIKDEIIQLCEWNKIKDWHSKFIFKLHERKNLILLIKAFVLQTLPAIDKNIKDPNTQIDEKNLIDTRSIDYKKANALYEKHIQAFTILMGYIYKEAEKWCEEALVQTKNIPASSYSSQSQSAPINFKKVIKGTAIALGAIATALLFFGAHHQVSQKKNLPYEPPTP